MSTLLSANMSLPVPVVGVEPGPKYASDINECLQIVDQHNHAPGSGVQINTTGLNIDADLELNSNNLTEIRSLRLEEQVAPIGGASDLGCVYNAGGDLYFNDALGNQIQITVDGHIAGTQGSISNLGPPNNNASASYIDATQTIVFQQDVNQAANLDVASVIIRKTSVSSAGIELAAPAGLASDYTITLPVAAPGSTSFLGMDSSGNVSAVAALSQGIILSMLELAIQRALCPAGSMLMYGGTAAPAGFLMCDGSSVLRATYPALFTAIGTAYGAADGTHFNVPDFRGRFIRGVDNGSGRDPDAAGRTAMNTGGNSGDNVGSVQGYQIQSHFHNQQFGAAPVAVNGIAGANADTDTPSVIDTGSTGGNETRPTNAYSNFIIKT